MKDREQNILVSRVETAGAVVGVLGVIGFVVSGAAFIVSEQNLTPEMVKNLSEHVNEFFAVAMASITVSGIGVGTGLAAEHFRK